MSYILKIIAVPGKVIKSHTVPRFPCYVKFYNPDAHDGQGETDWTDDPLEAVAFDSFDAALDYWRQISTVRPLRADGMPNRPLTALTIEIEKIETISAIKIDGNP